MLGLERPNNSNHRMLAGDTTPWTGKKWWIDPSNSEQAGPVGGQFGTTVNNRRLRVGSLARSPSLQRVENFVFQVGSDLGVKN
jgi:hypothetical protein